MRTENAQNACSFTDLDFRQWAKNYFYKFLKISHFLEHISPPQISLSRQLRPRQFSYHKVFMYFKAYFKGWLCMFLSFVKKCASRILPVDLEGFYLIVFENSKKKKKTKNHWYTSEMGSWYSKIKYRYDSLNKKEPPPEIYSWHFSVQIQWKCCLFNVFKWYKTCARIHLRFPIEKL